MSEKLSAEALEEREEEIGGFLSELKGLEDPRRGQGRRHTLLEILLLILCAQICGFETLREYELYGKTKINFLKRFSDYQHGFPSRSTIARLLAVFNPSHLEEWLIKWVKKMVNHHQHQIAIDGKRHRGVVTDDDSEDNLHLVHAYGVESGIVFGQEKVSDKSNEITAIPVLLDNIEIEQQIISIDAMGCQKAIAEKIIDKKADYVLSLKGNQGQLHADIQLYFQETNHLASCEYFETHDKGHGRIETRKCYVTEKISWLKEAKESWSGLRSIVAVESIRLINEVETREMRYFISSLPPNPQQLLTVIRGHWGVESWHWCLDVVFREDDRIVWNRRFAHNEAIIRRVALNLLKKYQLVQNDFGKKSKVAIKSLRKLLFGYDEAMTRLIWEAG
jgi:predicted transposase YbfD/YdcC